MEKAGKLFEARPLDNRERKYLTSDGSDRLSGVTKVQADLLTVGNPSSLAEVGLTKW